MADGSNMYLYCSNNSVNFVDLWGLCKYLEGESVPFSWWQEVGLGTAAILSPKIVAAGLYAGESAVLYSGPGAKALAAASSGIPIFKTVIGGTMNWIETSLGVKLPQIVWDAASAIYAATAKGTVQVFLTEPNYSSTFYRIEAKIIEALGKAEMVFK